VPEPSAIIEATDRFTARTYARYPVAFVSGRGSRLFDERGRSYLDFFSGLAVSSLGHGHPGLARAVAEQAAKLVHTSNLYYSEPASKLAKRLVEKTFADRVFFCNSGTEANEAAIKMARRNDPRRHEIVSAFRSFHGRTLGALAATGQPDLQEGFGPMPGGFVHVPFDDTRSLEAAVGPHTAAVIVEPKEDLRRQRRVAHLRRGANRRRSHGHALRLRADRRDARHTDHGQGPRRRRSDRRRAR
jgi:acetylornithine/succinyldiaminopimelate/putrescine aminotransferase